MNTTEPAATAANERIAKAVFAVLALASSWPGSASICCRGGSASTRTPPGWLRPPSSWSAWATRCCSTCGTASSSAAVSRLTPHWSHATSRLADRALRCHSRHSLIGEGAWPTHDAFHPSARNAARAAAAWLWLPTAGCSGIEPLPGHPTGEKLCPKGRAAPELVYHPDRITRPLRRTQPKGAADPGWVAISWDEALAEIAGRMARDPRPAWARAGGLLGHDAERQPHPGFDRLDRALHSRLRQPQHHLRHRDLQLAQGLRGPLHVWPRHRHAGFRQHGLHSAVGQQSRHHLARRAMARSRRR